MELTAVLTLAEEGRFVALNPETGTATQGESIKEALCNLREATALSLFVGVSSRHGQPSVRNRVYRS
jgi:predicted RNase H-like HicB family nuclease